MHSNGYTFGFAAALAIVCSFLLSLAYTALKPIQDVNVDNYVKSNILGVAKVDIKEGSDIQKLFKDNIKINFVDVKGNSVELNEADAKRYRNFVKEFKNASLKRNQINKPLPESAKDLKMPLYTKLDSNGEVELYIIPIHGMGLWDLIEGYVALKRDLNTISGITFYQQKETAGLGAEIQAAWFPKNFVGKKIYSDANELVGVAVKKGTVDSSIPKEKAHMVDGISGATITGNGVTEFLLKDLTLYEPAFKKILEARNTSASIEKIESAQAVN